MIQRKMLFAELDRLEAQFVAFWRDLCNIESPSDHKPGLDCASRFIRQTAQELGLSAEIISQEKAGDMARVTLCNASGESPFLLSAHIDTVHALGSFGQPPVKIEGDVMRGPGVLDDKGGAAAALYAMAVLKNCGYRRRDIIFIAQTDEEVSSQLSDQATIGYICQEAKKCEAFLNLESFHSGEAILRRKGILRYRLQISGKAAHAARCGSGKSALLEAAHKIIEIEKYKDKDGITCSCGVISAGEISNTVPDKCQFQIDVRYFTQQQREHIQKALTDIAQTSYIGGTQCSLELISSRPAMELNDRNLAFFRKMNEIYRDWGLPELRLGTSLGGSDAANVSLHGVQTIDSLGCEGGNLHTVEEFAYVRSLKEAASRVVCLICGYDA